MKPDELLFNSHFLKSQPPQIKENWFVKKGGTGNASSVKSRFSLFSVYKLLLLLLALIDCSSAIVVKSK